MIDTFSKYYTICFQNMGFKAVKHNYIYYMQPFYAGVESGFSIYS